jgi:hypothetical protein
MEKTFSRNDLYDEVWTTPLTRLGKKYGLSDNGVRKICRAMNIPLPKAGHWAKVAAGQVIPRTPLPDDAKRASVVSRPPEENPFRVPEDDDWLRAKSAEEESADSRISVDLKPARWHAAIAPLRDKVRAEIKEVAVAERDARRAERTPRLAQSPDWQGWRWKSFVDRGEVLLQTHKRSPMRVTTRTHERALAILNALCFEAARRGFVVQLNVPAGRIQLTGHEAVIDVRISEPLAEKVRVERNSWDNKPRSIPYKVPTGKLVLNVGEHWSEVATADTADEPLETKLNQVFIRIYRAVIRQREQTRKRDAREREWKAEEARREAAAARRREEEARKDRERRKRSALIVEAKQWRTAQLIRDYVSQVMLQLAPDDGSESRQLWKSWAMQVADQLDPVMQRQGKLRGGHEET